MEEALEEAKNTLSNPEANASDLNASHEKLMQAFSSAGQEMYQSQAASDEEAEDTPEDHDEQDDDDVVEADYEIVE